MTWASCQRRINHAPTVTGTRGTDSSGTMEGAGGIGGLLARSHGYSAGNWSTHNYYHADGNGNITYLVNSSQTLAPSYRYDPYGNTISSSGTLAAANVYRFSSKEYHASSGFYYYGYRWYAPNLQRWLNRDPIEEDGGLNLYEFVFNSPLFYMDTDGLGSIAFPPNIIIIEEAEAAAEGYASLAAKRAAQAAARAAAKAAARALAKKCEEDKKKRCDKEWEDPRNACAAELAKPNPSRAFTGGYKDIENCAKRHVTEDCGGNFNERPPKPKKRKWIFF